MAELSALALADMTPDALAEFALIRKELRLTENYSLDQRCKQLPQYVRKVGFYIQWVRHGRSLPPLQIPDPSGAPTTPLTLDDFLDHHHVGKQCLWYGTFCLRQLRGLNYAGCSVPKDTPSSSARLQFVLQTLGIDAASVAHLHGPGESEFYKLARYRVTEKLRKLGWHLRRRAGVVSKDGHDDLTWAPSTDVFNDRAWVYTNSNMPGPNEPSSYPEALPPGFLLPYVSSDGPPPLQGRQPPRITTNPPATNMTTAQLPPPALQPHLFAEYAAAQTSASVTSMLGGERSLHSLAGRDLREKGAGAGNAQG